MRLSRHSMFMEMARIVGKRGTCPRLCVGAIVVVNNRPISIGYNGSSPGTPHCMEVGCAVDTSNNSCVRAIHAEFNAIKYAGRVMDLTQDTVSVYVTHSPCLNCAKTMVDCYVNEVYFETPYRDSEGLIFLADLKVQVFRVMTNGYMVNGENGELIEAD